MRTPIIWEPKIGNTAQFGYVEAATLSHHVIKLSGSLKRLRDAIAISYIMSD
ncbi:hypothetical protein [Nostoc sp. 106C]|uniref:hypothetical protein n=1 Tax=Nostoc sp. 106C TaxID=1932667 RepID=UPI001411E69A|nr:hypothetical protein [Nostoc sp. 106C]